MTNMKFGLGLCVVFLTLLTGNRAVEAEQIQPQHFLIHMKTSLAEDDAQICAVPNVAWALVKAGHQVTILVDASAVTSVTKGLGWFERLVHSDTTAFDRARLPERERVSLSEQMGVSLEEIPHQYGEYWGFLKEMGVTIYGNQTMMLLYNMGVLNNNRFQEHIAPQARCISEASGRFKKACPEPFEGFVQQGRSHLCAQSVLPVREHGKMARTPLAAFFNGPNIDLDDVAPEVTAIALNRMVELFQSADRIIVY